jgi:hypothetical protein
MLSDKIATPNKAGTLKGVSPISSSRNVMVKVKDTASFIEAARAVHGDKYDYSQTVWTKANDPISFKCNCCGRVITNSGARKHIFGQQSGCGKCYRKPTPPKNVRDELRNRPCKVCGNKINSTSVHKVTCSAECGRESQKVERVKVSCCNCGKVVEKYPCHVRENNCCSDDCQRKWAGSCGVDWLCRSKKAKTKWKEDRRNQRFNSSLYGLWNKSIRRQLLRARPQEKQDAWTAAINVRFTSSRGRDVVKKQTLKPSGSIDKALARIDSKRVWFSKDEWDKKLSNKLSSLSSRRRRKRNAKGIKDCSSSTEARGVAVQMCFDWMEDHASVL